MYFVELGQIGDYDYYSFKFKEYKDASNFAKTLIDNGFRPAIGYDETEE